MKETPVSVLCKQIKFYRSFIVKLKTKDGIDKDAAKDKLNALISECEEKIKEFEAAMKTIDAAAKCEQASDGDNANRFDGNAMEKAVIMIGLANQMFGNGE